MARPAVRGRSAPPKLARADEICVLVTAHGRVLVSNSVRYNVGDLLPADAGLTLAEVGCFGWLVGRGADQD